jgi:hypothetical protein
MIDIDMKLRRSVGIKEDYVIQKAIIGSHGQVVTIAYHGNNDCRTIGVMFNSINKILLCKDDSCEIESLDDDITETCQSGLLLADLITRARLVNQRYCLAKKIYELILVSDVVGKVLSKAQAKALQNLQRVIDRKNLFSKPGERENIFRIVITFNDELETIRGVQKHKAIERIRKVLHCNGGQEFNICGMLQNVFNL